MTERNKEPAMLDPPAKRRKLPDTRPDPPNWYAVYVFESSYSKPASDEDLDLHSKARQKVLASSLPESKKKRALDYLNLGEGARCGRFSVVQTEAVANKYIDGKVTDDHLDFERKLMEAWCGKRMPEFIDDESVAMDVRDVSTSERRLAKKMLALAKTKSNIIMAIASSAMRVYYSGSDEQARMDLISKAMELVESASERP
jgi:hypothetical protein